MKDTRHKTWVVARALFWIGAGIAVAAYLVFRGIGVYEFIFGSDLAPARVIATHDNEGEDDRGRIFITTVAEYEFLARGVRFRGTTEGSQGSWSEGDDLTVRFNPQNPNDNQAAGDSKVVGKYILLLVIGGLFALHAIRSNLQTLVELRRTAKARGTG